MKLPRISLRRPSRTLALVVAAVIAVAASGLGATTAYAYAGDVPRGTTVLGVDLGAKSRADAEASLRAALDRHAEALAAPVPAQVGDVELTLDPAELDLAVDVEATVARAVDARVGPFSALFGSREVPPVVSVDEAALEERLAEPAEEAGATMTMPEIVFEGTDPVPVYPEPGLGLDLDGAVAALTAAWPPVADDGGQWRQPGVVAIPLAERHPASTAEDVDRLLTELAEPAVAAPVTVTTEGGELTVPPEAIAASLRLTADERGEIVPRVDGDALREALGDELAAVETEPVDARVVLRDGEPTVVESEDGERVDTGALADDLLAALPEPAPRSAAAELVEQPPELTTEDAEELGVREQVSTFTTHFEGGLDKPRNHNIATVADLVDGALVLPGETFSLNGHTGERGYDQGFKDAPVILDGRLQPAVGGGISQFTTTLFNASYYAGLEDVEHKPHSYYYSRYPAVIEATIFYPTLDMKFRNDTQYGVLIDTSYDESSVTVSMYSTKIWDEITTEYSDRRDIVEPTRQYLEPDDSCIDTNGIEGFTQDAWRVFHKDGVEVEREKFTWQYDAQPEFICGEDPDAR